MTNGASGDDRLSRNERRESARQKARALREEQKKKERRNRVFLQGGLVVLLLAIITVVGLIVINGVRPPSPGPLNMLSDGVKIGQGFKATPTAALEPDAKPVPSATNPPDVIDIQIYIDYQCPICGTFEATNSDQIKTWLKTGAATEEIHPIAILDNQSLGAKYSTRAANAAACVANYSPNDFFDYNAALFSHQPEENTTGLTDAQLIKLAKQVKPKKVDSISSCITGQKFKTWVTAATNRATTGPIAKTNVSKIQGTPTVIINGVKYQGAIGDKKAFAAAVVKAAGDTFTKDPTVTSSPSPSPSPTATP
ncbi:MAG TPA: thioredoxin domain-containing protein [Lacisediminihabitans sp.]|uniref:thioredoxin domain-containing protein n=1 Tax=Lacisediminihabitans sp. TaxID=2787631 RepID=UPI002ED8498C